MIKSNKIYNLIVSLALILLFSLTCFFGVSQTFTKGNNSSVASADSIQITDSQFNESLKDGYAIGAKVTFPASIKVKYNDAEVDAINGILIFPNGLSIAIKGQEVLLSQTGKYVISYSFTNQDNKIILVKKEFVVGNPLYSLSAENGSITPVYADEEIEGLYNPDFMSNDSNVMMTNEDGLIVRLGQGNTFSYSKSIDLTNVGVDGLCDIITLDYKLTNYERKAEGESAFQPKEFNAVFCTIRLTDSYDPNNYIDLVFDYDAKQDRTWYHRGVFSANHSGAKRTAITTFNPDKGQPQPFATNLITLDDNKATREVGDRFVAYTNINPNVDSYALGTVVAPASELQKEHTQFAWKYDHETNRVYVAHNGKTFLVSALSDGQLYEKNIFEGFESKKVKLSILVSDYMTANDARLDITRIGTDSGKVLADRINANDVVDDIAPPLVNFDFEMPSKKGIYAPVGSEFVLPVPNVIGGDDFGTYQTHAFSNYNTNLEYDVPIVDGKLKIAKNLLYTIKYSALNNQGSVGETLLNVYGTTGIGYGQDKSKPILLGFDDQDKQIFAANADAGKVFNLPAIDNIQSINFSENPKYKIDVKIKAVHEKETIEIDSSDLANASFVPHYAGQYKVIYELTDGIFALTEEYAVNVVSSQTVGFDGDLTLPRYFIKNASYSLNIPTAYYYGGAEPEQVEAKAYVIYSDGTNDQAPVLIENAKEFKLEGDNPFAKIKFVCQKDSISDEIVSQYIPIVDVGFGTDNKLIIHKYFDAPNFESLTYSQKDPEGENLNDVRYDVLDKNQPATLKFINAIDVNILDFQFSTTEDSANYNQVIITLTDIVNPAKKFVVSYKNIEGKTYVNYAESQDKLIGNGYVSEYLFERRETQLLSYDSNSMKLKLNNVEFTSFDLPAYFTQGMAYLDIELVGVDFNQSANEKASIIISSLNRQSFLTYEDNDYSNSDAFEPKISAKDVAGNYEINTTLKLFIPTFSDVLSPILDKDVYVTVARGSNILSSTDGTLLSNADPFKEYEIILDTLGRYTITYSVIDQSGYSATKNIFLSVVDTVAPTISFNETFKDGQHSCKVGDIVNVEYTAADDVTALEDLVLGILVRDLKTNAFYTFTNPKLFFAYEGDFQIIIYARDASGNYAYQQLFVSVR